MDLITQAKMFATQKHMMMPFYLGNPMGSLPDSLGHWKGYIAMVTDHAEAPVGVGYLTIDECLVKAGETQRRPGKHVDGIGPDGKEGGWGGGGGWGSNGMLITSSYAACDVWVGDIDGYPAANGSCEHLSPDISPIRMKAGDVWWFDGMCLHESVPVTKDVYRQFCRISYPSNAPWYEGYTENPLGIEPTGPIHSRRSFMDYRP